MNDLHEDENDRPTRPFGQAFARGLAKSRTDNAWAGVAIVAIIGATLVLVAFACAWGLTGVR